MKTPSAPCPVTPGQWHGKRRYFGLHYDLHAGPKDTELGSRCSPRELVPMLRMMGVDFVQTDCKGHPGMTSWFSKVPNATVSPGVVKDAMAQWRQSTRQLRLPLHCHYSGIWDKAAGKKHPAWCIIKADGKVAGAPFGDNAAKSTGEKMCPRGPYADKLMIPQLLELIDRYQVDGFWIDGDMWGMEPCYCKACRKAFHEQTGLNKPPTKPDDPNWHRWWNFTRESFEAYVTHYCNAVHAHKPGVLVCSNWLQTFKHPGEPKVPTDWISGDNSWVWGLDGSRCEARFLSTRGKPWDIMLWNFYCSHGMGKPESPWTAKPVEMLQQEAAVLLAFGGNVQVYENPGVRTGQLIPWRAKRIQAMGRFVHQRRAVCQGTETIPQIAVLHSETHLRRTPTGANLMWNTDASPVQGAVFSLLECSYGVDILDEWALLQRLDQFPVIVAPEQDFMSDAMVAALKGYVERGGRLLVSGAKAFERFGKKFLGVKSGSVEEGKTYHVPAADGSVPIWSKDWRRVKPTTAKGFGRLALTALLDERLLPEPAYTVNRVGKGQVAYVGCNLFRDFTHNRYPLCRTFIGEVCEQLAGNRWNIRVSAPVGVDVTLRRKAGSILVHFVNRGSGIPNQPNNGAIDCIPTVGPMQVRMRLAHKPSTVKMALEPATVAWRYSKGWLTATVDRVRIHNTLVICRHNRPVARIIALPEDAPAPNRTRLGSAKGSVSVKCDLTAPALPETDWEAMT